MSHEPVKVVTLSRVEVKVGGAWAEETLRASDRLINRIEGV